MKHPEARSLARRHHRLSWVTGMVLLIMSLWLLQKLPVDFSQRIYFVPRSLSATLLETMAAAMYIFFLFGVPAGLSGWAQCWLMRKVFAHFIAAGGQLSPLWLAGAGALMFVSFTLGFLGIFVGLLPGSNFIISLMHNFKLVGGLLLPWLISSVGAAWWLGRQISQSINNNGFF